MSDPSVTTDQTPPKKTLRRAIGSFLNHVMVAPATHWVVVRMLLPTAIVIGFAYLLSSLIKEDTVFSIQAVTRSVRVDVSCDDILRWDLPTGDVRLSGEAQQKTVSKALLSLRGGSRATLRMSADGRLNLLLGKSPVISCPGYDADAIRLEVDGQTHLMGLEATPYASTPHPSGEPIATGGFNFIIKGRIVLGQQITQGGGWSNDASSLLYSGSVDARTPDGITGQKRLIHAEQVEPGSEVDSHACLDSTTDTAGDCVAESASRAQGFLFFSADAQRDAAISAQISVVGKSVGIRQFGGTQRKVVVTHWSKSVTSSLLQLLFALVVGIAAIAELGKKVIGFVKFSQKGWRD